MTGFFYGIGLCAGESFPRVFIPQGMVIYETLPYIAAASSTLSSPFPTMNAATRS